MNARNDEERRMKTVPLLPPIVRENSPDCPYHIGREASRIHVVHAIFAPLSLGPVPIWMCVDFLENVCQYAYACRTY